MTYEEFLEGKKVSHRNSGFDVELSDLNTHLFPFQKYCVQRSLKAGRFALFADTGLGKTIMQLEWADKVAKHNNSPILILAPLSVVGQTVAEGVRFGYSITEIEKDTIIDGSNIFITNYEDMDNVDLSVFCGVVLDESSILKNFDGKTKQKLIDAFAHTSYKLACTATPSPNDIMELCNHTEFLNVMTRNEMLAMYFVHDGGDTTKWRLKGHSERAFWDFVSTWALMITTPSDIGFSDEGYVLPPLNVIDVYIETPKRNNGKIFNDVAVNATDFNKELRLTKQYRLDKAIEIANSSDESFIIWISHDNEGEYLRKYIPDAIEVKGSDSKSYKKEHLLGFAQNKFRVLITKLKIASMGMNYQNCHNQIFASLDFSFEKTYQGMRRSYRFLQTNEVNCYLIVTDTMQNVRSTILQKQKQFEYMQKQMSRATNRSIVEVKSSVSEKKELKTNKITLPVWITTFQKEQQFTEVIA